MSRIGKMPIPISDGVRVHYADRSLSIEGPKGKSRSLAINDELDVKVESQNICVVRKNDHRRSRALHGLTRTLISNMVNGVTSGFKKNLEIVGVGYRAEVKGSVLVMNLGYSAPTHFPIPEGITITVDRQTLITVEGTDKHDVGMAASKIRSFRKPETYKGKGVRYSDEKIRKKVGKASSGSR